jgi:hypothetical protein
MLERRMNMAEQTPPLPEGMPCPGCGYDVGGQAARRCPECGRPVTREDLEDYFAWQTGEGDWRRVEERVLGAVVPLVVLTGVLAWFSTRSGLAAVFVGGVSVIVAAGVFGLAGVVGRCVPRVRRRPTEAVFVVSTAWLLLPWGLGLAGVLLFGLLGLAGRLLDIGESLVGALSSVAVVVWLVGSLVVAPAVWIGTMRERQRAHRAELPRWAWLLGLVLVWAPSIAFGAFGLAAGFGIGARVSEGKFW